MLDLIDEFRALTDALAARGIDYALCGGLAMAVHGKPRATVDIDLLILSERLDDVLSVAREHGFALPARPMTFAGGAVIIHRRSKPDPEIGDVLTLDLLLVTPQITTVWETRREVIWRGQPLQVVSRAGLIALKSLRQSGQDIDDIRLLQQLQEADK